MNIRSGCALALVLAATGLHADRVVGQKPGLRLPLPRGASIVTTLKMLNADRESVHTIEESTPRGIRWSWRLVEIHANSDTISQVFRYSELETDLNEASRLWFFHSTRDSGAHPGYTMHAISRSLYRKLRAAGSDSFQVMLLEAPKEFAGIPTFIAGESSVPVRWKGMLTDGRSNTQPFPLLLNGRRIEVRALRLHGRFSARNKIWEPEIWVLADSTYPLILKVLRAYEGTDNVLQTVRVDDEMATATAAAVERGLASSCRVELPGIYFAFNSAVLDSASDRTLTSVADVLKRHADWRVTLEGHTDSIGTVSANKVLSERRVAAVKERLTDRYGIDAANIRTAGFGSARPREPNSTIEGRARNRRVELVRACGAQ